jgi:hypothetical protein
MAPVMDVDDLRAVHQAHRTIGGEAQSLYRNDRARVIPAIGFVTGLQWRPLNLQADDRTENAHEEE